MIRQDFDQRLDAWLWEGPSGASGWVLEAVVEHAHRHPRRGSLRVRWGDAMRALALGRPATPAFRLAVLLAVLALAAAGGAAVYVGSQHRAAVPSPTPTKAASACPAGSTPDDRGPFDQQRPLAAATGWMVFDRGSGLLLLSAAGADNDLFNRRLWAFDVCTNTWRQVLAGALGDSGSAAYVPSVDLTVAFSGGAVRTYDVDTGTSSTKASAPANGDLQVAYDPVDLLLFVREMGTSRLWTYNVTSDVWREIVQLGDVPPPKNNDFGWLMAYDASVGMLVLYGPAAGSRTFEFDARASTWRLQPIFTPDLDLSPNDSANNEIAYDDANARTVIFSDGKVAAYDASTHRWQIVFATPPDGYDRSNRLGIAMAYDPMNQRLVVVGGRRRTAATWLTNDDVLAFDLRTRTWIELLAPSGS